MVDDFITRGVSNQQNNRRFRLRWIWIWMFDIIPTRPQSFRSGPRVQRDESLGEEASCPAVFKAPDRFSHMLGGREGGREGAWLRRMSGKTRYWLRAAQSTSLLYWTSDCARWRTTTNSQVGIINIEMSGKLKSSNLTCGLLRLS